MDKLESMNAFVQVVDAGGFTAASRVMGLSKSQVNKLVANLENALGVQLLYRTTRQVTPTDTGRAFYERCVAILSEVEEAEQSVIQGQTEIKGTLKVNAPMSFGISHLSPILADFARHHPDLQIQLTLNDQFIDPLADGYDLTIRIADQPYSSGLVSHNLGSVKRVLCASPNYLQSYGIPNHPEQLKDHSCLHYGHLPTRHTWQLKSSTEEYSVLIKGAICSNNGDVLRMAALKGLGITLLPTFFIDHDLAQGSLQIVLPDYRASDLFLSILYPVNRHLSHKVQQLIKFISEQVSCY